MNPLALAAVVVLLSLGFSQAGEREKILVDFKAVPAPERVAEKTDAVLSEVAADRVLVLPAPGTYSEELGAGFVENPGTKIQHRDRGAFASPLLSDGIFLVGKDQTAIFQMKLPPGRYRITTYHHDLRWPSKGRLEVSSGGNPVGILEAASQGKAISGDQVARVRFDTDIGQGQELEVSFALQAGDATGAPSFPVNGLYVEPLP